MGGGGAGKLEKSERSLCPKVMRCLDEIEEPELEQTRKKRLLRVNVCVTQITRNIWVRRPLFCFMHNWCFF